jgi:homoserine acetyltransferase
VLYPFSLQSELAQLMPHAEMYAIDSPHGHDAFLIEIEDLNLAVARFRRGEPAVFDSFP